MCNNKGATKKAKSQPKTPVSNATKPCLKATAGSGGGGAEEEEQPEDVAKLVSVDFLDGSDTAVLAGAGRQIVNLPAADKWATASGVNKDRLSNKPRILVKFDKPGAHTVKLRLKPGGSNSAYTDTEKNRNGNFKFADQWTSDYTTGQDGTLIITDMKIAAGGDDEYEVEAKDKNNVTATSGGKIKTERMLFYIELKMRGLTSVAPDTALMRSEFQSNFITLRHLGSAEMDLIENIGANDDASFKSKALTAYNTSADAKDMEPYCVAVAFTSHLAVKNTGTVTKTGVTVGPTAPKVEIDIVGPGLNKPAVDKRYLWKNIVTGESWFVSCKFENGTTKVQTSIPVDKCSSGTSDMSSKVEIDVTGLPAGTGDIALQVNWVDRMRGGLSFNGGNLICACSKAWWQNKAAARQNEVLIHEFGHKVGMVANGTGKLPDKVSTWYDGKGHVGDHCHNGVPLTTTVFNSTTGTTCVMFGATNQKSAFCANCKPAVRKMDLSAGWSRFS